MMQWIYEGRIPIGLHIRDDAVLIWLGEFIDDCLDIHGLLESTNPTVVAWAESLYPEYRTGAELLDPAIVPAP